MKIKPQKIYAPLYHNKDKFIILVTGGRGSGKSFNVSTFIQRLLFEVRHPSPEKRITHQILYTRYTMVSAHISVIPEFMEKVELDGHSKFYRSTKTDVKNLRSDGGVMFRGIKTSSGIQTAKLKSIHGITTFVVDEAEEWVSEKEFETIMLSIRQKGIQNRIIIVMNPTDNNHWVYKRFIENTHKLVEIDGVQVQVSTHPNVLHIHTTYLDNLENLSPEFLKEVEQMKKDNPEKYAHVVMGRWADVAEGAIYKKWGVVKSIPQWCKKIALGLDFGFTHDETAIVMCGVMDNDLYIDEICYKTQMLTKDIIQALRPYQGMKVIADSADPRLIQEIANAGIRIYPVEKGQGSIIAGIEKAKEFNIFVTERSYNLMNELRNYVWDKDKDGHYINQPADGQADHLCFVGDTLVMTIDGEKRIDSLKVGDNVLTSKGYRKVTSVFNNGYKKILRVRIKFSTFVIEISGTPDHKIKTIKGWKRLRDLSKKDVLFLCKSSMAKSITNMKVNDILQEVQGNFIEKYGNSTKVRFQKDTTSTILMVIRQITTFLTLSLSKGMNTCLRICKHGCKMTDLRKDCMRGLIMQEHLRPNGISPKMDANGIVKWQSRKPQKFLPRHIYVNGAEMSLRKSLMEARNFVQINAKQHSDTILGLITKQEYAKNAESSLLQTNIQRPSIVADNAQANIVQRKEIIDVEIVEEDICNTYDIEVEDMHEFFANGILVHNCDSFRYYVYGMILGKIQKPRDNSGIFAH